MKLIDTKTITRTEKTYQGNGDAYIDFSQADPVIRFAQHIVERDGDSGDEISREVLPQDNVRLSELAELNPEAPAIVAAFAALLQQRADAEAARVAGEAKAAADAAKAAVAAAAAEA